MKKIVSLTLVTVFMLALCLPIAARFDQCKQCEDGLLSTETRLTFLRNEPCSKYPESGFDDKVYLQEKVIVCDNCSYEKVLSGAKEVTRCNH